MSLSGLPDRERGALRRLRFLFVYPGAEITRCAVGDGVNKERRGGKHVRLCTMRFSGAGWPV
jgi:hypothetical protein